MLNKKNQTTETKTTAGTKNKRKWAQQRDRGSTRVKRMHVWSWLANHPRVRHPRITLQSQHLHETWRQVSCNRSLALLHDAIMSHCELWVDLNLRMGDFSPLSCDYVNFIPSSARDCGGFDWPWLGCWNLVEWQKKKRFIYIYLYMERERERERGSRECGKKGGRGGEGQVGAEGEERSGEGWG